MSEVPVLDKPYLEWFLVPETSFLSGTWTAWVQVESRYQNKVGFLSGECCYGLGWKWYDYSVNNQGAHSTNKGGSSSSASGQWQWHPTPLGGVGTTEARTPKPNNGTTNKTGLLLMNSISVTILSIYVKEYGL